MQYRFQQDNGYIYKFIKDDYAVVKVNNVKQKALIPYLIDGVKYINNKLYVLHPSGLDMITLDGKSEKSISTKLFQSLDKVYDTLLANVGDVYFIFNTDLKLIKKIKFKGFIDSSIIQTNKKYIVMAIYDKIYIFTKEWKLKRVLRPKLAVNYIFQCRVTNKYIYYSDGIDKYRYIFPKHIRYFL